MRTLESSYQLYKTIIISLPTHDYRLLPDYVGQDAPGASCPTQSGGFLPPACMIYTNVNSRANYNYHPFLLNVIEALCTTNKYHNTWTRLCLILLL